MKDDLSIDIIYFSGPDSLRMHRQKVLEPLYTGEAKQWTPEQTSSAFYLMRAAPGAPHPRPKSAFSDAYGWGAWGDTAQLCSWSHNAHPIKVSSLSVKLPIVSES